MRQDHESSDDGDTASATADLNADVYGLDQTTSGAFSVGGNYDVQALADAQLGALASSTNDHAEATSESAEIDITGAKLDASGAIEIGGDATLIADANADFEAE